MRLWSAAYLERCEAERRGVSRDELVREACERLQARLREAGAEESTRKVMGG